jgi:hypothetical protein
MAKVQVSKKLNFQMEGQRVEELDPHEIPAPRLYGFYKEEVCNASS